MGGDRNFADCAQKAKKQKFKKKFKIPIENLSVF